MLKQNDARDVAAVDQSAHDRNRADKHVDVKPEAAQRLAPIGFGKVESLTAEYAGEANDPDSSVVIYKGDKNGKILVFDTSGEDYFVGFEALARGDQGMLVATRINKDYPESGEFKAVSQILDVPWHVTA